MRARDIWRIDPAYLEDAQDAAALMAIRDQERAGLDIVTDGEVRRESYSNYFVGALEGVDLDNPGSVPDRNGNPMPVPRVTGAIRRRGPVQVRDVEFLRANTERTVKVTVPGPFTMAAQAQNDFYEHPRDVAFAFADAVREEVADLFAAGADVVQLDEPWMESRAELAREFGLETLQRALDGIEGTTALHICFGYPLFVPDHARSYRYLAELADAPVDQISIESAQAQARPVRARAPERQDRDPRGDRARRPGRRVARDRRGAAAARAALPPRPDRRAGLRHEVPAARVRVRQASSTGGRGGEVRQSRSGTPGSCGNH